MFCRGKGNFGDDNLINMHLSRENAWGGSALDVHKEKEIPVFGECHHNNFLCHSHKQIIS
jgi:hypothetical protein